MPNADDLLPGRQDQTVSYCYRGTIPRVLALTILLLMTGPAAGHPDLLLQIERLDQEIATDPHNAALLARRGDLHRRHQDYAAASIDLEAARAADPGYALVDFLEAALFLDTGRPDRAEQSVSRYLLTNPEHAAAWILRAEAWLSLGQPAAAAEDYRQAIAASRKPGPELYRLLVLSLAAQGAGRTDAALQAVNEGLERFPVEISLLGLAVDIALAADRSGDAVDYFDRLPAEIRRLPRWAARLKRADCLETAAEPDRISCLRDARENLERQIETFLSEHAPRRPLVGYSPATD